MPQNPVEVLVRGVTGDIGKGGRYLKRDVQRGHIDETVLCPQTSVRV